MAHVMGCDPHLDTFTAAVVDDLGRRLEITAGANSRHGWSQAVRLARRHRVTRVGIEAASGYGRSLAETLTGAGFEVVEIPTRLTANWRKARSGSKSDQGDAELIARATAAGEGSTWTNQAEAEALRVLVHRRRALVKAQTAEATQLRALLAEIDPPRAAATPRLRSTRAFTALSRVRYRGNPHREMAATVIRQAAASCRRRLQDIRQLEHRIAQLLPPTGRRLADTIPGIGVWGAAVICAEMAGTDGFASDRAFAKWAGVAPLQASSGRIQRHRLNRGGNRRVNHVIHTAILYQLRNQGEAATYITRRETQGRTRPEAIRAAARHLARRIWKTTKLT